MQLENDYQAYLIRFQRGRNATHWRATLENVHEDEVMQFATERELLLFVLRRLTRLDADKGEVDKRQ